MSKITIDDEGFKSVRFPDDPADYTVDDHMIEATAKAREAVEAYWQKMDARPSLADFEVTVATHYNDLACDEAGHEPAF